ncbi:hypothetical protein BABINDRAFT_8881 [Babjeviella inositovora NRRL Y-12698]|uniref:Mediator of RNA polymerase II transcription subunit 1 n=1 Tax=Babjeviella inositovora NRRL Y-12698 TaxID=984486 RepID=A0A1E3QLR3_9ASCO|nr:uncharacterized protein BABINDRAFT_8881 [Babjeviella inositovora NRRL Y-12698]ODQ78625.1 hypothetical protein BABINDRAFT_8881 [Babjeviella inositovora NRRL Y-12698]
MSMSEIQTPAPPDEIVPQLELISKTLQRSPNFQLSLETVQKLARWLNFQAETIPASDGFTKTLHVSGALITIDIHFISDLEVGKVSIGFPSLESSTGAFTASIEAILLRNLSHTPLADFHSNLTTLSRLDRLSIHNFDLFHYYDSLCSFMELLQALPENLNVNHQPFEYWGHLGAMQLNYSDHLGLYVTYFETDKHINRLLSEDQEDQRFRMHLNIVEVTDTSPQRPFAITKSFEIGDAMSHEVVGLQAGIEFELQPVVYLPESLLISWGNGYTGATDVPSAYHNFIGQLVDVNYLEYKLHLPLNDVLDSDDPLDFRKLALQINYLFDGLKIVPVKAVNLQLSCSVKDASGQLSSFIRNLRNWIFLGNVLRNIQVFVKERSAKNNSNIHPGFETKPTSPVVPENQGDDTEILLADFLSEAAAAGDVDVDMVTDSPAVPTNYMCQLSVLNSGEGLRLRVQYQNGTDGDILNDSAKAFDWVLVINDGEVTGCESSSTMESDRELRDKAQFIRMLNRTEDLLECLAWI